MLTGRFQYISARDVIDHLLFHIPDRDTVTKFKENISRLQIDWMVLQNRQALRVGDGFWAAVGSNNLRTIFATEVIECRGRRRGCCTGAGP